MLAQLKAYPRIVWILAAGIVINHTGMSFLWPMNMIYVHEILGKTLTAAGLILFLSNLALLLGNVTGGLLFDRWSGRKTVIIAVSSYTLLVPRQAVE